MNMRSIIKWKTGEPDEFGWYLTVRKSRSDGSMRTEFNQYAKNELMRSGPLPDKLPQGWQILMADDCDIVAWVKIKDIKVEE